MAIFLSHPDYRGGQEMAERIHNALKVDVNTNFWFNDIRSADKRADKRIQLIRECECYVFVSSEVGTPQLIRSIELGVAIGAEVPTAFIGEPRNPYHRFGDVFSDVTAFIAAWAESKKASSDLSALPGVSGTGASVGGRIRTA